MRGTRLGWLLLAAALGALLTGVATSSAGKRRSTGADRTVRARQAIRPMMAPSVAVTLRVPPANRTGAFATDHSLNVPTGWSAEVWALVPDARLEQWTPKGSLLVSEANAGEIIGLPPSSHRSAPPSQRVLVSGLNQPQGMAFDDPGGKEVLYVAETDEIDRYVWLGDRVGARTVLIPNLPSGDDHTAKN